MMRKEIGGDASFEKTCDWNAWRHVEIWMWILRMDIDGDMKFEKTCDGRAWKNTGEQMENNCILKIGQFKEERIGKMNN